MSGGPARPGAAPTAALPPKRTAGLRIGLLGGSFNPPHEGHRLATMIALRRLKLDRVWWLVTPGNPLKDARLLASLADRIAAAERVAHHPAVDVTGIETALGTRYTVDTLRALRHRCPGVHFVWIMGADNLRGFHRWQHWAAIARLMPIAVVDRPGGTLIGPRTRAGAFLSRWRIAESAAATLPALQPPAFVFLHGRRSPQSSTALRSRAV